MLGTCLENVRNTVPLVHNITNYVTVNDVANILLAAAAARSCPMSRRTSRTSRRSAAA